MSEPDMHLHKTNLQTQQTRNSLSQSSLKANVLFVSAKQQEEL